MTQIIFNMGDDVAAKVTEAFCRRFGYQPIVADGEGNPIQNPQSPAEFAQQKVVDYVRSVVIEDGIQQAIEAVRVTIPEQVNSIPVTVEVA